jgi:TolB-like protein
MKMKRSAFLVLLVGLAVSVFAQNVSLDQAVQTSAKAVETGLPKGAKAAVLTFTSNKQAFSDYIIDELATALALSKNIQVIDRQHTDAIRKEFNIQFSGDVSDDEVKRVGRQLGAQYVVTGSLVDIGNAYRFRVAAINIESAVREGNSSLNININDPQVTFLLTGQRTTQSSGASGNDGTYRIGDKGPGGGTVFYARDGKYMECSGELGSFNWDQAITAAQNYDGGGFSDWRLPTLDELNLMYVNLKARNLGGFSNGWYWSSSQYSSDNARGQNNGARVQRFSDGNQYGYYKSDTYSVRAVRAF